MTSGRFSQLCGSMSVTVLKVGAPWSNSTGSRAGLGVMDTFLRFQRGSAPGRTNRCTITLMGMPIPHCRGAAGQDLEEIHQLGTSIVAALPTLSGL
jgi:hypothetical protein